MLSDSILWLFPSIASSGCRQLCPLTHIQFISSPSFGSHCSYDVVSWMTTNTWQFSSFVFVISLHTTLMAKQWNCQHESHWCPQAHSWIILPEVGKNKNKNSKASSFNLGRGGYSLIFILLIQLKLVYLVSSDYRKVKRSWIFLAPIKEFPHEPTLLLIQPASLGYVSLRWRMKAQHQGDLESELWLHLRLDSKIIEGAWEPLQPSWSWVYNPHSIHQD